jgi:hypothetical protein
MGFDHRVGPRGSTHLKQTELEVTLAAPLGGQLIIKTNFHECNNKFSQITNFSIIYIRDS